MASFAGLRLFAINSKEGKIKVRAWATYLATYKQYLMIIGDAVIVLLALAVGVYARLLLGRENLFDPLQWLGVTITLSLQLALFFIFNLYDLNVKFRRGRALVRVTFAVIAATIVCATLFYFSERFVFGRNVLLVYLPVAITTAFLWRELFFNILFTVKHKKKVALVGLDTSSQEFITILKEFPVNGYEFVGSLCEDLWLPELLRSQVKLQLLVIPSAARNLVCKARKAEIRNEAQDVKQLKFNLTPQKLRESDLLDAESYQKQWPTFFCTPDTLAEVVEEQGIDTLLFSVTACLSDELMEAVLSLRVKGLQVVDFPTFYSKLTGQIPINGIDSKWLLDAIGDGGRSLILANALRVVEIMLALAILLVTAPLFLLIALAIKNDSRGPVLFKQERLGLNEEPFVIYKFRSMVKDAEAKTGPIWTHTGDPRVTRLGHFLRTTGLDELPQLFNILKGDMTFVGIRPIRQHFADILAEQIPFYRLRFTIRPGITGWAQVKHNYAGSVEGQREKFQYELFYLKNASPILDTFIILKTIQKLLQRGVNDVSHSQNRADIWGLK